MLKMSQTPEDNHILSPSRNRFDSDTWEEPYYFALILYFLYFICLRYLRRTILLRPNNTFFCIPFVLNARQEPYCFALTILLRLNDTFLTYSICLRYLGRNISLCLDNMIFRIPFVSDTWEEPYYFAWKICFSVINLSQIPGKSHITSH